MALIPWYQKCRCECSLSPLMFFPSRKGIWQLQRTITTLSLGNFTLDYVVLWPSGLTYNFQTSEDRREHPSGNPPGAWGTQHESSTWAGVGERQYSKAAVHTHCIRHTAKKTILDSLNQTVECKKHFYTIVCKTVALASLLPSVPTLSQTMSTRWLTTLKKLSREHQSVLDQMAEPQNALCSKKTNRYYVAHLCFVSRELICICWVQQNSIP